MRRNCLLLRKKYIILENKYKPAYLYILGNIINAGKNYRRLDLFNCFIRGTISELNGIFQAIAFM